MIKLIDILSEDVNSPEFNNEKHWRDHFKEIIKISETALSSKDPEVVAKAVHDVIEHAEVALDKHEATYSKSSIPTFVNSPTSNSYSGDDSDINSYQNNI
jgi:hypothetical protein